MSSPLSCYYRYPGYRPAQKRQLKRGQWLSYLYAHCTMSKSIYKQAQNSSMVPVPKPTRSEGICSFAHDEDTAEDEGHGQL